MLWYISMGAVFTFAGIGVKWSVDRMFGPQIQVVMPPRHAAPAQTPARRVLEFEDTMDVMGAAFAAGEQSMRGRLAEIPPALGPVPADSAGPDELAYHNSEVGPGVCLDEDGWKLAGPCAQDGQLATGGGV